MQIKSRLSAIVRKSSENIVMIISRFEEAKNSILAPFRGAHEKVREIGNFTLTKTQKVDFSKPLSVMQFFSRVRRRRIMNERAAENQG
jgi:hypothetical protein